MGRDTKKPDTGPPSRAVAPLPNGADAQASVQIIKAAIARETARLRPAGIDLYYVGPAALAVALGHRWNGLAPDVLSALAIVRPETVIRWHRAGFRLYWRWRSRPRGGRPKVPLELRQLIRDISIANPLWGAPRIHGELLKLGIDVGQTTVAKYIGPACKHRDF